MVERRGDQLILDFFTTDNGSKLFAQSIVDCSIKENSDKPPKSIQYWLEQVVDSSRYFTLRILGTQGREATIGIGFRDREQATDLRESMQHYETAMRREQELANSTLQYTIPKLAEGEKIHIKTGKNYHDGSSVSSKPSAKNHSTNSKKNGVPLLLKKPPPSPESAVKESALTAFNNPNETREKGIIISNPGSNQKHDKGAAQDTKPVVLSMGDAVYESNDDDWDTEFQSA